MNQPTAPHLKPVELWAGSLKALRQNQLCVGVKELMKGSRPFSLI